MNQRRWGLPLRGIKSSLEVVSFRWCRKELSVLNERIESGMEFQTVGAVGVGVNVDCSTVMTD